MTSNRVLPSFAHALLCMLGFGGAGCTERPPQEPTPAPEVKREITLEPVASGLDTLWGGPSALCVRGGPSVLAPEGAVA